MSNYGINISSKEVVFVHNAFLVESNREGSLGLWAKQICLFFAGWSRASFVVQTRHMQRKLAKKYDINIARIALLRPPPAALVSSLVTNRVFDFQCFYPCSRYTHKRVDFAEDVFCRIEDSKIGLVITADGVNDLPSTRRSIRYLGNKSETEVASWLSCSDILFFCSLSESLGLPLVDALRRGKPAVLPDLEYAREIFGDAAVYYSPDSIDSAVAAVGYACRNMQELKCAAELRWIVYRREVVTYANQFRAMVRLAARESSEKETTPEI